MCPADDLLAQIDWVHTPVLLCHCIESCVLLQVTKGTVDEGIYAMAERKLRLDAAVLDGVTATGDGKSSSVTVETAQVLLAPAPCSLACSLLSNLAEPDSAAQRQGQGTVCVSIREDVSSGESML